MTGDVQLIRGSGITQAQRRAAWERIVRAWKQSGRSAAAFAQEHGLRANALFRWRDRFSSAASVSTAPRFVHVHLSGAQEAQERPIALELHVGDLQVRVHNGCEANLLRSLIGILQERPC